VIVTNKSKRVVMDKVSSVLGIAGILTLWIVTFSRRMAQPRWIALMKMTVADDSGSAVKCPR